MTWESGPNEDESVKFFSPFVFAICQQGAEPTLKQQLQQPPLPWKLSFSRPGFLTFKYPVRMAPWSEALPQTPWIRTSGHAFGAIEGQEAVEMIDRLIEQYRDLDWEVVHLWERDCEVPGDRRFEPGESLLAGELAGKLRERLKEAGDPRHEQVFARGTTSMGGRVLDVIVVAPDRWWIGCHRSMRVEETWPGGVPPLERPVPWISRAYWKAAEAVAWSGLPLQPGDRVVELGSAPGGACQWLLEQGLKVTGVDPAEMDPWLVHQKGFEHWRERTPAMNKERFAKFRWLFCDANVASSYTLETVERIVRHPANRLEGLVLTLKLASWDLAEDWDACRDRVASWGFQRVRCRQLAFNRLEFCLVADQPRSASPLACDLGEASSTGDGGMIHADDLPKTMGTPRRTRNIILRNKPTGRPRTPKDAEDRQSDGS
jgi:23S rRNA (cytidine2498-2'-O)-methyltransferase